MSEVVTTQENLPTIEQPSQVFNLFQVLEKVASNPEADADKMVKVMDMMERAQDREAAQSYNRDMVSVQRQIPKVGRNKDGDKGKYANHEQIVAVAGPIWEECFALSFGEADSPKEGHFRTLCDCMHNGGHTKQYYIDLPIDDKSTTGKQVKTVVQGTGSTFTYGQRYLTCKIFNIPTGDDRDGNSPVSDVFITDDQALSIDAFIQENEIDRAAFMKWLNLKGGYESIEQILEKDHDFVMQTLRKSRGNS